jgi:hypothetical protein
VLLRFWKTVMGMRTGVVVMRIVVVTRSGVVRLGGDEDGGGGDDDNGGAVCNSGQTIIKITLVWYHSNAEEGHGETQTTRSLPRWITDLGMIVCDLGTNKI